MDRVINTRLISNPVNWIKVLLMVFIAALGVELIVNWASGTFDNSPQQGN